LAGLILTTLAISRVYNPRYFNRCVRALRDQGKAHPDEVPLDSQRISGS
jgi:hypothetical protein